MAGVRVFGPKSAHGEAVEVGLASARRIRRGEPISFHVVAQPKDEVRLVRVLVDSSEVLKQEKDFESFQIERKGFRKGQHELAVDVAFSDGHAVQQSVVFEIH